MQGSVKIKPEKNDWRTVPDDTIQVVNPNSKKVKVSPSITALLSPFNFPYLKSLCKIKTILLIFQSYANLSTTSTT